MTEREDRSVGTCQAPIDEAVLTDYWLARLPQAEEDRVEEHLLECDRCGHRLREVIQVSEALRVLARSGALRVIVAEEFIDHAAEHGQRVRRYDFAPGQTVPCTISEDDDLLVARLAADLTATNRVDLSFYDPQGVERQRMIDIPIRPGAGGVVLHESAVFGKRSPTTMMVARLVSVEADGAERLLGEYTFHHTRTIPGPAGWEW
jgi:hypothetical protein